jgi:hypothetical protein
LVIPEEESRNKQYREIAQLLQEQPIVISASRGTGLSAVAGSQPVSSTGENGAVAAARVAVPPPVLAPEAISDGAPLEKLLPSIMPDEFTDNHAVELDACKRWFSSDAGQVAKISAPAGYANVRAHAQMHQKFLLQQQAQAAQTAASFATPAQKLAPA